jgi:2-oxoisovalerate dehydrogenase E1 component
MGRLRRLCFGDPSLRRLSQQSVHLLSVLAYWIAGERDELALANDEMKSAQINAEPTTLSRVDASMRRIYTQALTIRGVEQTLLNLFSQGKLFGTVHTCIGQEFSGIAIAEALQPGDLIFSNHRCHGHFLARTGNVEGLIAELMGKQSGVCGGRGGSQHLCSEGFYSNGVQGGIVPVAAGLAFALQLRGLENIAVVFVGDGTLGEGAFYEALNIASKWQLPLFIVLENNLYAQSTSQTQTLAGDICGRAKAFGIETTQGDTWEPFTLIETANDCVEKVRRTRKPHFLQIDTYRLMAHSKGDDSRDKAEVERYWDVDPLSRFISDYPEEADQMREVVSNRVAAAVREAETENHALLKDSDEDPVNSLPCKWQPDAAESSERIVSLLHAALQRNMRRDERIVLIGEDIEGPYGGAFKVTRDLNSEFPGRVRNTPISEAAVVGLGNGMALSGLLPVVEIMFADFLFLAADQIVNHAAKFTYMYNNQVSLPLILRTPVGGKRGYGPTHSQSVEKHFMGVPGTMMLALNSRQDPGLLYDKLFATIDRPTIIIENKLLYGVRLSEPVPQGFVLERSDEVFPTVRLRPEASPDATIVCYGGMLTDVERAVGVLFEEHDVVCEIICPSQIYPLNVWPILESLEKSGRLLIVEEGVSFAAFSAEVIAQICEQRRDVLKKVTRLASRRHPIPSSGPLERKILPNPERIAEAVLRLVKD